MKLFIFLIALSFSNLTLAQDSNSIEKTQKLAGQGDVEAQFNLGTIYYKGEGVTQDYELAVKWFRKAAERGHAKAQYSLGYMYYYEQGVTPDDFKKAFKWFRKAAMQGIPEALHALAIMYSSGHGVPKNTIYAYAYFNIARTYGVEFKRKFIYQLERRMSTEEIDEAQELSVEIFNQIEKN